MDRTNSFPSSKKLFNSGLLAKDGKGFVPWKFPVVVRINFLRASSELCGIFQLKQVWWETEEYKNNTVKNYMTVETWRNGCY